jgi:hypothetical protein
MSSHKVNAFPCRLTDGNNLFKLMLDYPSKYEAYTSISYRRQCFLKFNISSVTCFYTLVCSLISKVGLADPTQGIIHQVGSLSRGNPTSSQRNNSFVVTIMKTCFIETLFKMIHSVL